MKGILRTQEKLANAGEICALGVWNIGSFSRVLLGKRMKSDVGKEGRCGHFPAPVVLRSSPLPDSIFFCHRITLTDKPRLNLGTSISTNVT